MSPISRLPVALRRARSQGDPGDECSCPSCASPGCAMACECTACREARPLIEALTALDLGDAGPADAELLGRPYPDFTYDEARRAGQEDLF